MNKLLVTRVRQAVSPPEPSRRLVLALLHPTSGHEHEVAANTFTIGRDDSCSLSLGDSSVSRLHAELRCAPEGVTVTDLGSTNGTFVNGGRVQGTVRVSPGDLLRLGGVLMKLCERADLDGAGGCVESGLGSLTGGYSMTSVFRQIRLLAPTPLRILVTGESGTGKELVARELHQRSGRAGPFIAVNCAALPEALVESELFGHVRGAFTGAVSDKPGLFEAAQDGTLFLDEVAELPLATQAKLLRVVETGELRRVGAVRSTAIRCRIISATNHELRRDVERQSFRGDLLARLAESDIRLPPLRERVEDLPALIKALAGRASRALSLDAEAFESLACYPWPLNIRELDNFVRTTAALVGGQEIGLTSLPSHFRGAMTIHPPTNAAVPSGDALGQHIIAALQKHRGNIRKVSLALGVSRAAIYRTLERQGKRPAQFRNGTPCA